jgi:hypothetical protein
MLIVRALSLTFILSSLAACKRTPPESTPPPSRQPEPGSNTTRPSADASAVSTPPSTEALAPPAEDGEFREAGRVLPRGAVGPLRQSGRVLRSNAQNLFQQIDGDAVSYQNYGVREYAKTDYRKPGTKLVATVSIYEFESPLGAFGRYSMHVSASRDPATLEPQAISIGAAGFQGRTQLVLVKGAFLVQIDVADESEDIDENALFTAARELLPTLARATVERIPGDNALPPSPLDPQNLVWGGATWVSQAVFNLENSGPGWVGWYRNPEQARYRVAAFDRESADAARILTNRFRLRSATPLAGTTAEEAFAVTIPSQGELVVVRRGRFVAVAAESGIESAPPTLDRPAKLAAALRQLDRSAPRP